MQIIMTKKLISPQEFIRECDEQFGADHVMLGGSWGLMPSLADAMNGWYEQCESMLLNYPQLSESEKLAYHREFLQTIWVKLGHMVEKNYMEKPADEDILKKENIKREELHDSDKALAHKYEE